MNRQIFSAIIIGATAAALGTIAAFKFINRETIGGGQPNQSRQDSYTARAGMIAPQVPWRTGNNAAPVVQNTPITEACYNIQPTDYQTTLGPEQNVANDELTLPI